MKYLFVLIVLATAGCFTSRNNPYELSDNQERDLINIITYLRQIQFNGSISINSKEVRNSSAEIISTVISDSIFIVASKYSFTTVIAEPDFTYFIMDGFKGKSFGLLFTLLKKDEIKNFYDIKVVRKARDNISTWYFVSSKMY